MVRESLKRKLKSVGFVEQAGRNGVWHYTAISGLDVVVLVSIHHTGLVMAGAPGEKREKLVLSLEFDDGDAFAQIEKYCSDLWG